MRRVALLLAVALAFSVPSWVVAQAATPATGASALIRTNVRYVVPYGPNGLSAKLAGGTSQSGSCDEGSTVLPARPDAWFCTVDGGILDPCFANPWADPNGQAELACLTSPWDDSAQLVTTSGPLPQRTNADPGKGTLAMPWAIELAGGKQCGLLRGATAALAGKRINFGCKGGGSVISEVDRSQPLWVVNYLEDGAMATTQVPVVVAWD